VTRPPRPTSRPGSELGFGWARGACRCGIQPERVPREDRPAVRVLGGRVRQTAPSQSPKALPSSRRRDVPRPDPDRDGSRSTCGGTSSPSTTRSRRARGWRCSSRTSAPRGMSRTRLLDDSPQDRRPARLGPGVRRDARLAAAHPGSVGVALYRFASPPGAVPRRGSRGDCPARSSSARLANPIGS
jgi:hypothetical protein